MQVWNGSICALGAVGEPAIIVTLMMMSSEHNPFLYYMHEMYQLCWTWTVSPNLISISGPSLLYHGVVFITITLKHYCVYMLKCYDGDSHRMAGAWSVGFGYGIQSNWYGQLKHVHFISMHLWPDIICLTRGGICRMGCASAFSGHRPHSRIGDDVGQLFCNVVTTLHKGCPTFSSDDTTLP